MKKPISPCNKDCQERCVGCVRTCQKVKQYEKEKDFYYNQTAKETSLYGWYKEFKMSNIDKGSHKRYIFRSV